MSANGAEESRPSREIAYRLFAAEFDDASFSYSESDEERAPNYVVTPTGARVNRMFAVGVLTEVEPVNDDVLRGRVVDPTGAFVSYAGQYQPDEMAFLDRASPPAFVALSGKARTFQPEDSDRVFTSVRPESMSRVDADTRDRWTVSTAEATLHRVGVMAAALQSGLDGGELRDALLDAGVDEALAKGIPLAIDHYETTPGYLSALRRLARDAIEVVANDRDSVRSLGLEPSDAGDSIDLGALAADLDLSASSKSESIGDAATADPEPEADSTAADSTDTVSADAATESAPSPSQAAGSTDEGEAIPDFDAEQEPADATGDTSEPATQEQPSTTADTSTAEPSESTVSTDTPSTESTPSVEDDLGDFEPNETESAEDDLGDFDATDSGADIDDDGMYELDEDERAEIEAEFGTEFSTGSEVAPAGEADIDVPSVEELEAEIDDERTASDDVAPSEPAASTSEPETDSDSATSAASGSEPDNEPSAATADDDADTVAADAAADVDLETVAVEVMDALDDGDGASREAVVARVVDEYGADPEAVEDAIQSALMSGQCYEPTEDSLKAI